LLVGQQTNIIIAVDGTQRNILNSRIGEMRSANNSHTTTLFAAWELFSAELSAAFRANHDENNGSTHTVRAASLNPRQTVGSSIIEGPVNFGVPRTQAWSRAEELMGLVRLRPEALSRYPSEFSGGQHQRISIARA
jgi:ABC-type glutathione transport system ATPase component